MLLEVGSREGVSCHKKKIVSESVSSVDLQTFSHTE